MQSLMSRKSFTFETKNWPSWHSWPKHIEEGSNLSIHSGNRLGRSQISNPEGGDGSSSTGISFDELSWFGPLVFFCIRVVNSPDFMLERFVREENHWHCLLKDVMSTYQEASHNRQEIQFFFCSFCIAVLFRYFTKCQCAVWFMFCSKLKVSQCCSI